MNFEKTAATGKCVTDKLACFIYCFININTTP